MGVVELGTWVMQSVEAKRVRIDTDSNAGNGFNRKRIDY
ncbi:hypothetical protein LG3211_2813 [Lysobacter gummosus]|nr:hypothetical protein LG3211_2813 [Lysobacter gummosus]